MSAYDKEEFRITYRAEYLKLILFTSKRSDIIHGCNVASDTSLPRFATLCRALLFSHAFITSITLSTRSHDLAMCFSNVSDQRLSDHFAFDHGYIVREDGLFLFFHGTHYDFLFRPHYCWSLCVDIDRVSFPARRTDMRIFWSRSATYFGYSIKFEFRTQGLAW
jgi:hypothetical protein